MVPRSLRDPAGRRSILDRLAALSPQHPRRWGRMEPVQLLPHLASGLRMALGEQKSEGSPPGLIRGAVWRYLAIHRLPWPEGKIQAPPGTFSTPINWGRSILRSAGCVHATGTYCNTGTSIITFVNSGSEASGNGSKMDRTEHCIHLEI
jgi:hypothetical protein